MVTRNGGHMPWALVLCMLAAVVASGQGLAGAHAATNETAASANGETLHALLSTTSRVFSTSKCVDAMRKAKNYKVYIKISTPKDATYIPRGAEAWCNCLRDNEPARRPGYLHTPEEYEAWFDICRDQVMLNSDYNAVDLCRGSLYYLSQSYYLRSEWITFCARRMCAPPGYPYDGNGHRNPIYGLIYSDTGDLFVTCADECVREVSAVYCSKYRLQYGGWTWYDAYYSGVMDRRIAIDGKNVPGEHHPFLEQRGTRDGWIFRKVDVAKRMCDALYPTNQARCCTYDRGLATLSQCCYEKNGKLEFNCNKAYGGDRLRYNCGNMSTIFCGGNCDIMIDYYVAHPTYKQAKLAKLLDGQISVVFPEAFMDDFCNSQQFKELIDDDYCYYYPPNNGTPVTREYCCNKLVNIFGKFVENCQPGAGSHESLGAARLPVTSPAPSCDACSYVDENGECKSVCKSFQECAVRNRRAFCVQCNFFRQDFPDGKNCQCCELRDGDSGTLCRSKVNNEGQKNKCFTNEGPWTKNNGEKRKPQPHTIDAVQNVCNDRDNFWANRKLCKVQDLGNGRKECKYISDKKRESILAGR